jgi:hypothetical protein
MLPMSQTPFPDPPRFLLRLCFCGGTFYTLVSFPVSAYLGYIATGARDLRSLNPAGGKMRAGTAV